jgi:hypothetical protein
LDRRVTGRRPACAADTRGTTLFSPLRAHAGHTPYPSFAEIRAQCGDVEAAAWGSLSPIAQLADLPFRSRQSPRPGPCQTRRPCRCEVRSGTGWQNSFGGSDHGFRHSSWVIQNGVMPIVDAKAFAMPFDYGRRLDEYQDVRTAATLDRAPPAGGGRWKGAEAVGRVAVAPRSPDVAGRQT